MLSSFCLSFIVSFKGLSKQWTITENSNNSQEDWNRWRSQEASGRTLFCIVYCEAGKACRWCSSRQNSKTNSAVEHRRSLESRWLSRARNELSWFSSEGIQGISGIGVGSQLASRKKTWLGRSSKEKERQQDCSKPLGDRWLKFQCYGAHKWTPLR